MIRQAQTAPLIVFVHVPKTAGSTVNATLKSHSLRGRGHVEEIISNDAEFRKAVNSLDWISGHVRRDRLAARIRELSQRPARFFACVRNPFDHLASHYNWIARREAEFEEGSHLHDIYSAMSRHGFTPRGVVKTLEQFPDLLDFQARFLLPPGFEGSQAKLQAALKRRFELVAVDPDTVTSTMLGRRIASMRRENAATYVVDPSIFYDADVLDFLADRNRRDEAIYKVVSTLRGGATTGAAVESQ